jgi:hypothetical protein
MIKLTNAVKEHAGKVLIINPTHILSIFEATIESDGAVETVTNIYCITQQAWQVKETVKEVLALIK